MSVFKPQKVRNQGFTTKLLPYTPYVYSWPYRTDIFSLTRWQDRPKTDTWVQEVEKLKNDHESLSQDISELLNNVAKMVDRLEEELNTTFGLQKQCGFNRNGQAVPIGQFKVIKFLPTHLLDAMLWAAFDDTEPTTRLLICNDYHPELALGTPWHPKPSHVAYRFLDFSGDQIDSLTNDFLSLFHSTFPSYGPVGHLPTATLTSVESQFSDPHTPQQEESPSKWPDGQTFLAHASTAANAMNAKAVAQATIVSCNLWVLISSLIFLMKNQDQEYGQRFSQAVRFMNIDSRTREMLDWYFQDGEEEENARGDQEVDDQEIDEDGGEDGKEEDSGEENDEEQQQQKGAVHRTKGKGKARNLIKDTHFATERLVLATAALCHSPIFVLNTSIDLSRQKEKRVVPYHDLSLKRILMSSFDPSATNTRATASERMVWKLIIKTMAESLSSKALTRPVVEPLETSVSDTSPFTPFLHNILKEELQKFTSMDPVIQSIVRLEGPSSSNGDQVNIDAIMSNPQASNMNMVSPEQMPRHLPSEPTRTRARGFLENRGRLNGGESENERGLDGTDVQLKNTLGTTSTQQDDLGQPIVTLDAAEDEEEEEEVDLLPESSEKGVSPNHAKSRRVSRRKKLRALTQPRFSKKVDPTNTRDPKRRVHEIEGEEKGASEPTQQYPRKGAKRQHVHWGEDDEQQPPAKKTKNLEKVIDTTYQWTTHVDIKLEHPENLPPVPPESPRLRSKTVIFTPTWEDDVVKEVQREDDSRIPVIRHVLLPDGKFHRETITFTVIWPPNYRKKQYFWSLLQNSRPAELGEGYEIQGGAQGMDNMESSSSSHKGILPLSHFDCLEQRYLDAKQLEEREIALARAPQLILRPRSRESIREAYTLPILNSEDIRKNLYVNVYIERQVHDSRKYKPDGDFTYLRAGSIHQVIEQNRRAMNMLDIPNPNLTLPNFIQKLSLDSVGGPLTEGPGFPFTTMKWNLCATQPALTQLHYDAGKVATWVHMRRGTKIWFVLDGEFPDIGLAEVNPQNFKFVYYVLEEGSIFTMPPGTVHAVLNVTDCFAEGGHMFLSHGLHRSFNIGLREHLKGVEDTNTNNTQAEAVLHGIWTDFYTMIVHEHEWIKGSLLKQQPPSRKGDLSYELLRQKNPSLPLTEDMVSLLCMCVHAMAFEPQVHKNHQNPCPESIKLQRTQSRERAEECIFWLEDLWGPLKEYESKISANLKKSPFNIGNSEVEYIINPLIDPIEGKATKGPAPVEHHQTPRRAKRK